jgi:Domain of unknown function (DUF4166)
LGPFFVGMSSESIPTISRWFGAAFSELHPLLQDLHLRGGTLAGPVDIRIGRGIGRLFGAALARQFAIPAIGGSHPFAVTIFHGDDGLHWHRRFGGQAEMKSLFVPVGTLADGYWIETNGPVRLALTVDIVNGSWHWRCLKIWLHGMRMPLWLLPKTTAFKRVENGRYRFFVGLSLPLLGTVLSYGGLLDAVIAATPCDV